MNKENNCEVSVLIVTYNSELDKIRLTINSILIQNKINFQIVIADDGSIENKFKLIENIFRENNFDNYVLVPHEKNQGTVKNVYDGLRYCYGKFVKLFSPGDFFSSDDILAKWVSFMENNNIVVSFCDAIYYNCENGKIKNIVEVARPQQYREWDNKISVYYSLYDDIGLGAASLCNKDKLEDYMKLIVGRVIYAEDNVYRLMAVEREKFVFFEQPAIYYEFGTGVSTQKNDIWSRRLKLDWEATNVIINDMKLGNVEFKKNFCLINAAKAKSNVLNKVKVYICVKGYLMNRLKMKHKIRFTSDKMNMEYISMLLDM